MLNKTKGQRAPSSAGAGLLYTVGVWDGSRDGLLGAPRRGFDSPHVHILPRFFPADGCVRLWGMSSGVDRRHGWNGNPLSFWLLDPKKARVKITCLNCCLSANRFGKDHKGFQ